MIKSKNALPGFWDASAWEKTKREGDESIRRWISRQLHGTSVTVVLIGTETSTRNYVTYEIDESYRRGNGLVGIYIHQLKDQHGKAEKKGENPFECFKVKHQGKEKCLSEVYPVYDWVDANGYKNINRWIEKAARQAGR